MKTKTKKKKNTELAELLAAGGLEEDKKQSLTMIVPKPIRAVTSNAVSPEKFKAALRKVGRMFGYKISITDDFSGLTIRMYCEYVGKVHVFEPSIKEHNADNGA